jgi:hypothetical protein
MIAPGPFAHAVDFCQVKDEKPILGKLDAFFTTTLREHAQQAFSRQLKARSTQKARSLLEQNILDRKVQLCADKLKLANDIRNEPAHWDRGDCAAAAVVGLVDAYMRKVAQAYDDNRQAINTQQKEHLRDLKHGLFEIAKTIAKGAPTGLEGTISGAPLEQAPKNLKYEWVKLQASKLAGEAHRAWGAVDAEKNPLVQENLVIAREAVRARNERESTKAKFRSDGKLPASCVRKP